MSRRPGVAGRSAGRLGGVEQPVRRAGSPADRLAPRQPDQRPPARVAGVRASSRSRGPPVGAQRPWDGRPRYGTAAAPAPRPRQSRRRAAPARGPTPAPSRCAAPARPRSPAGPARARRHRGRLDRARGSPPPRSAHPPTRVRRGRRPMRGAARSCAPGEAEVVGDLGRSAAGSRAAAIRSCSGAGSGRSAYTASRSRSWRNPSRPSRRTAGRVDGGGARRRRARRRPARPARRRSTAAGRGQQVGSPARRRATSRLWRGRRYAGSAAVRCCRRRAPGRSPRRAAGCPPPQHHPRTRRRPGGSSGAASAATSASAIGPTSISVTGTRPAGQVGQQASSSGRDGRSRRVSTSSKGSPPRRRPMCAVSRGSPGQRGARRPARSAPAGRRRPLDQPQHGLEHPQPLELRRGHRAGGSGPARGGRPAPATAGSARPASAPRRQGAPSPPAPRASSSQTANGVSPPTSMPAPIASGHLPSPARCASSAIRLVLPIPASPVSTTTRPGPSAAARHAAVSCRSSAPRPNSRGRPAAGAPAGSSTARPGSRGRGARRARRAAARRTRGPPRPRRPGRPPASSRRSSVAVGRLVQRAERHTPPGPVGPRRRSARRRRRPRPARRARAAAASRCSSRAAPAQSSSTPGSSSPRAVERVAVERVDPHLRRRAQPDAGARRLEHLVGQPLPRPAAATRPRCAGWPGRSPRGTSGHSRAATTARGCVPGCSASQPIRARARSAAGIAQRLAVAFAGEAPTQPQPQHLSTVDPSASGAAPRHRICWTRPVDGAVTMRGRAIAT